MYDFNDIFQNKNELTKIYTILIYKNLRCMVKRKTNNEIDKNTLIYLRDDIIVKFGDINCIAYTNVDPKSSNKEAFSDGLKRYVVYFVNGAHYTWVIITDEDFNRLKKYFVK